MQIHVYDTYVKAKDGHTMHFDVFTAVKDDQKAVEYAKQWLLYRDWETDRKSTRLNSSHSAKSRMPSSA